MEIGLSTLSYFSMEQPTITKHGVACITRANIFINMSLTYYGVFLLKFAHITYF